MKKIFLLIATLGVVFCLNVESAPRLQYQVTKTYRNDGNMRQGFSVSITSTAWTSILPASETRRYAIFHTTAATHHEICLSTVSVTATTCLATTDGRHMPRVGTVIEDWSEAVLYGRLIAGESAITAVTVTLLGEKRYDTGD